MIKKINKKNSNTNNNKTICPDCGSQMIPSGGCMYCNQCGYSPCK